MRHLNYYQILILLFTLSFVSCDKNKVTQEDETGKISIEIAHTVEGFMLETDQLIYSNAAGNQYLISNIQWFISGIQLIRPDKSSVELKNEGGIFYIDTDIVESMNLLPTDEILAGEFSGMRFTFGISEAINKTHLFVNPPQSFMFWPDYLGGGYHYMKLNGKWINNSGVSEPFNFHLGIGQVYDSLAPKSKYITVRDCCSAHCEGYSPPKKIKPVVGFIHNEFVVQFEDIPFTIEVNKITQLKVEMKIENWFKNPNVYDHNFWRGSIMQQQAAMKMACENGIDVFRMSVLEQKINE